MAAPDVPTLLALDLETRLALVQKLWDSIVEEATAGAELPLPAGDRDLLEQRLREDNEDPDAAIPWAEARAHLHRKR
jgi:putative addiction module component (TIGR02574 family)